MSQQRVAFYIRNLNPGGIQRVVITLANRLVQRGYAVDLLLANGAGELRGDLAERVAVHNLGARRVLTSLPGFVRYVRSLRPDVVVSAPDSINLLLPWCKRLGLIDTRVVVTVHNNMSQYAQNEGVWYGKMLPYLLKCSYPLADQVVTVSAGIADDLFALSEALRPKTKVIYNPIVHQDLLEKARVNINHPWLQNRSSDQKIILGVGRFTPQKNFSLLLRAFARARQTVEARLILLGDGPDQAKLRSLIRELGLQDEVDLPGFVSNPYAYFSRASLFVLSSVYEGFGNVLVEAMVCGCPVVSTDCPSGPHEILEGGKWGKLVPVHDVDALAGAMCAELGNPTNPSRLRQRAEDFTVDAAVESYLESLLPEQATA